MGGRWFGRRAAGDFARNRGGNVAMMWGIMGAVLVGMVGVTVDFTRAQAIRSQIQNAADGAALAAARATGLSDSQRLAAARAYFNSEAPEFATDATFTLTSLPNNAYRVDASVPMTGSISRLISQHDWTVTVSSDAKRGGVNLEVALVLDTTGSMSGSKITALRTAATSLVNTVVNDVQTPYYSKLALVSYAVGVNVGSYASSVRGSVPSSHSISGASWSVGNAMTVSGATRASPVVVTANAHGFQTGDVVYLSGIKGMTQINNHYYTVGATTTNTFELKNANGNNINGTNYSSWQSGGTQTATKCQVAACQVVVTSSGHGFANNAYVFITGVNGMTQINNATGSGSGTTWQVANATTDTFVLSGSNGPSYNAYTSGGSVYCTTYGCQYYRFTNASGGGNVFQVSNCTTERTGDHAYDDAAPTTSLLSYNYPSTASQGACPSNTILPLTSDRSTINARISGLNASGYTAGQIGASWGWYMLAPNFGYLWPSDMNRPASYTAAETAKVMVLMTDGAFNTSYCHGVIAQNTSGAGNNVDHINCDATNGDPLTQALNTCSAMKAKGIIIYTVGFDMSGESQASKDMMRDCATNSSHAYMADDATALQAAFDEIAQSISQLRLTH